MNAFCSRPVASVGALLILGLTTALLSPRAKSAGGPIAVSIANAPLPVSVVNNAAHTPVALSTQVVVPKGQGEASKTLYTVPDGKRLVIQNLNAVSQMDVVQNGVQDIALTTTSGYYPIRYSYPATSVSSYNWVTAGTTLLYADPGTQVTVGVTLFQKANASGAYSNIALVGYLEDAS